MILKSEIIDIFDFLNESIPPYGQLYGNKFEIPENLEHPTPVLVNIDSIRMQQVLDNLFNNANKYTPKDGKIILTTTLSPKYIQISISDNGCGIDSKDLDRIFEQFVSIPTPLAVEGTGIGLFISKIICEAHGGSLSVHSQGRNLGANFIIELPLWLDEPKA